MKKEKLTKSAKRVKDLGEVFTPKWLVIDMLRKLPHDVWEDDAKTFCDPACGNGNFLAIVLQLKLRLGHDPTQALRTIYGVDIMPDNISECKQRLLKIAGDNQTHRKIVETNIVCHDALTYDFSFNPA
jgi:type I restriction-modification system DNA methylase subunit